MAARYFFERVERRMSKSVEKMIRPENVITSLRCEKRALRRGVGVAGRKFLAPALATKRPERVTLFWQVARRGLRQAFARGLPI
jgi:hypothetical protein